MALNEQALKHFIALARQGKSSGCSGGEARARKLALLVLDQAGGLDGEALDGLCEFVRVVSASYSTAKQLLGE